MKQDSRFQFTQSLDSRLRGNDKSVGGFGQHALKRGGFMPQFILPRVNEKTRLTVSEKRGRHGRGMFYEYPDVKLRTASVLARIYDKYTASALRSAVAFNREL